MSQAPRGPVAEQLVRRLAAALRAAQLYAPGHPIVVRSVTTLAETLAQVHTTVPSITIGIVGNELVVGDAPLPHAADNIGELMRQLQSAGIERIAIDCGVAEDELAALVRAAGRVAANSSGQARAETVAAAVGRLPHVRVGRLQVDAGHGPGPGGGASATRQAYDAAVSMAEALWESARTEGMPDPLAARGVVDSLAESLAQNRTSLLALTALKQYDNYTFTHMVNVSLLTMGQARALGINGQLLRDFGLAALMHDIGKVRTPIDILNKPDKLTEAEFEIMKRHPVDGAVVLRRTPDVPALAPIVAFEHHLRADGTGYPDGVIRSTLNLGTALCGIADVYDAMRSQRAYQQAFPTDRILAVLKRNDGTQFDRRLVRRFVQLVGIYPVGNLVRLNTGQVAVVTEVHAPDPHRPRVRVIAAADGTRLSRPYDRNLWEFGDDGDVAVEAPLDPADVPVDPLSYL